MDKVRVALIGAGSLANAMHYPSLASFDDVEIVGLCDINAERLKATATKFGIGTTYADYRTMIEKTQPDAVYAIMPPHILFEVAMDVLQMGHHLFIEKPPGVTTFQADCLARSAEKTGLITGVGFQRRYHPLIVRCYQEVTRRGRIHQVASSFYKNLAPQERHPYYRGSIDILHCDVIHAVDSLRYYAGLAPVRSVASSVRALDCWYDVSFNALVTFENDVVGVLQSNWRSGRRFFRFEFHGYGATSVADIESESTVWADNGDEPVFRSNAAQFADSDAVHVHQGFLAQDRAFIDAVKTRSPLHNSIQDSVETMRLADSILAGGR